MNQEFINYVKDNIKIYLPKNYENAVIEVNDYLKANDQQLQALNVRNNLSLGVNNIYLNEYEERYSNGESLEKLMLEIKNLIVEADKRDLSCLDSQVRNVLDYEKIKSKLALRLCDYKTSNKFLTDKPFNIFGNLAITYRIQIFEGAGQLGSSVISNFLLENWGISKDKLHKDALKAENNRSDIVFYSMGDHLFERWTNNYVPTNLYRSAKPFKRISPIYTLTNTQVTNGASTIARENVLDRIGNLIQNDFYILPSSIHEVMIAPANESMNLKKFDLMVEDINKFAVSTEDKLSDHSMFYDRESQRLSYLNY